VFRLSLAFVDGMDLGEFPEIVAARRGAGRPEGRRGDRALRRARARAHQRVVRGRVAREFERIIKVYYGPQSGHDLLERTAWHGAQHLRQLYVLASDWESRRRADADSRVRGAAAPRRAVVGRVDYDQRLHRAYRDGRTLSAETGRTLDAGAGAPPGESASPRTILDLGAGTGRFSAMLADAFDARVVAVEPSRKMRARPSRAAPIRG
jgi:hypothetical protein